MQRILSTLILLITLTLLPTSQAKAWFFDDDPLVTIDGNEYMPEDFKHWWGFWKEEGMAFPDTPEPYIDWLLLAREGQSMELDSAPGFKRGTRIFLQSRTLLKLKYEEIDSQIKVTEADIKRRYEENFLPRYLLEGMEFSDEATASKVFQELTDGAVTVPEVLTRAAESSGPVKTAEMTLRASELEKKWKDAYKEFAAGDVLSPKEFGKSKVLWYLKEIKAGDDEDLAALRESISKDLWKEQEIDLTRNLIEKLREKYAVKVDEERLVAIDLKADMSTLSDDPVITTSQQNYSEKAFSAVMERLFKSRPMLAGALVDEHAKKQLMIDTAYNVFAQSVTYWE
ncbi:MAG: peptidylprolyl isomerase, partial [Desulfuromusa sp.]|nr:peptidylprolyl isomerase [Desulfuromusa sp.]